MRRHMGMCRWQRLEVLEHEEIKAGERAQLKIFEQLRELRRVLQLEKEARLAEEDKVRDAPPPRIRLTAARSTRSAPPGSASERGRLRRLVPSLVARAGPRHS